MLAFGSQVVLFGDHPGTGRPYFWVDDTPVEVPLSALPTINEHRARNWLVETGIASPQIGSSSGTLSTRPATLMTEPGASVTEGGRNDFIFHEARSLAESATSVEDLTDRLMGINVTLCMPPLPRREVQATVR